MDTVGTREPASPPQPRVEAAAAWTHFSGHRLDTAVSPKPSSSPDEEHPSSREEDGKAFDDKEEGPGGEKDGDYNQQRGI